MSKKIMVRDLRDMVKGSNSKTEKFNDFEVKVKEYLSVTDKMRLVNDVILQTAIGEESIGFSGNERLVTDMSIAVSIVKEYTDIALPNNPVEAYDLIVRTGLYKQVLVWIGEDELQELTNIYEQKIRVEEERSRNELESSYVLSRFVNKLSYQIDEFLRTMPNEESMTNMKKELDGLDKDKLKDLIQFVDKNEDVGDNEG